MTDPPDRREEEAELQRIAEVYTARDAAPPPGVEREFTEQVERSLARALRDADVSLTGTPVLEVGCGSGHFLQLLHSWGARPACGIDLMENRIELGREIHPDLDLLTGTATDLPYPDERFGMVSHFTCLSSVLDPLVRAQIAHEMWRVLAPGGVVVSHDMRPAPAPLRAARRLAGSRVPSTPLAPLSAAEVRELFPGEVVVSKAPALHPGLIGWAQRSPAAVGALSRLPFLRSHLLVVIRKPS